MTGILSKIEALDDADESGAEAVDVAVDRVFGERENAAATGASSTTTLAAVEPAAPDERGIPMPPIGERKRSAPRKPEPPKPARGPRPNVRMERERASEAKRQPDDVQSSPPAGPAQRSAPPQKDPRDTAPRPQSRQRPPAPERPPQPTAEDKAALADKAAAALNAPAKGGRVPPRLRKRQEQANKGEQPEAGAQAPKPSAQGRRPAQQPAAQKSPAPAPSARGAQSQPPAAKPPSQPAQPKPESGRRKVGMPEQFQNKQQPPESPAPSAPPQTIKTPPPKADAPAPRAPQTPPQGGQPPRPQAPPPVARKAEADGPLRPPPPLPELQGVFEPLPKFEAPRPAPGGAPAAIAERAAPPPPLPPAPPGGAGGGDSGGDGQRPMPIPDADPPAHEEPALAALKEATDLSNCLMKLLYALNWRGDKRHVAEALPHFTNSLDITSFRNIMATLHYQSRPVKLRLGGIDSRLFPCLYLPDDGDAMILLGYEPDGIRVFDGGQNKERVVPRGSTKGTAFFFSPVDADEIQSNQSKVGWFRAVSERFRALVYQSLGITFVLNILALVTPLFVMAVYDKVVATGSLPTLAFFAFGVGVAIGCDVILRMIRSKIMAFIGARLDNIVGIAIFHKILFLPPTYTERATIGAQVARIKDFETIRDFFTGPMALVLFELPFVFIFIITIAALAGPVVFVSVIMMACFLILGLIISPLLRNSVGRAARASSKKQELIVETLSGMRAVKYCGAEDKWMERFREYSATAALNSFYTAQLSALMQTISHVLMISAGLGTIIFGVFRVMNGDMSVGGLVASMILVWRVLAPLQTAFVSLTRLTQVKSSISQINNLMNIRGEREQHTLVNPIKQIEGFVTFARVSIRYSPDSDPALVGVSFELEPGDVLCIVGGNGSGKSTALKLLAGMYAPQAGSIRIDNMDIRQMDTVELRHAVAYVPQTVQFFYGTIAQNLRLAHPTATEADLHEACEKAAVLDEVLALSQGSGKWKRDGFEVRIGDSSSGQMPTSLLQRLNLARGYLKNSPIMLFDEPGNGLDFASDQAFMRNVERMRGSTTVLMVTHRPSHLRLADKILWLEYGNVRAFGGAEEVLKQMPKDFV
ncbi:MAG: ATP-binding cassette domain-containing protein [Rhodospirillales bacterium]|nr:ATP-binding cassette domain-containing protein [Rhodospirillales bacterium]